MKKRTKTPISDAAYERLLEKYPNCEVIYGNMTSRDYLRTRIHCLTCERDEHGKLTITRLAVRCGFNPENLHQYMSENIAKKTNIGQEMATKLHTATNGFLHAKFLHQSSYERIQQIA